MSDACLSIEQPSSDPVIWTSAQLTSIAGLSHGFTGRPGGASSGGSLSGLNLSLKVGDAREDVLENRARVARALGCSAGRLLTVKQVHGDHVVRVTRRAGKNIEADGIWTTDRGALISVLVADCVPIILADRRARVVAAVHAGWRGTCAKIAAVMVRALVEAGFEAEELVAAVGPAIGPECFEIGPEVAEVIRGAYPDAHQCLKPGAGDRWVADLWELNRLCLIESGIPAEQIDVAGLCTYSSDHFYSYRRDGGTTGRQAGVVTLS